MNRKCLLVLLAAVIAALCLARCTQSTTESSEEGLRFYYLDNLNSNDTFGSPDGALGSEMRTFPDGIPDYAQLLNLYFAGPKSDQLRSPFPENLQCLETSLDE